MHWGGTLLAHHTGPWLRACAPPFYSVCRSPPPETRLRQVPNSPPRLSAKKPRSPQPRAPETEPSAAFARVFRTWDRANAQEAPARVQRPARSPRRGGSRTEPDRAGAASRSCHLFCRLRRGAQRLPRRREHRTPPWPRGRRELRAAGERAPDAGQGRPSTPAGQRRGQLRACTGH